MNTETQFKRVRMAFPKNNKNVYTLLSSFAKIALNQGRNQEDIKRIVEKCLNCNSEEAIRILKSCIRP
jgi:hypothetical protein